MSYRIIVSPASFNDTFDAFSYYEEKQEGLGLRFILELEKAYSKLQTHPSYYSYINKEHNIRAIGVRKFPYRVIYEINDKQIFVFAVYNSFRHPNQLLKRFS